MTTPLTVTRQDRLLVLAVHPDDETLGAGGLLQQAVAAGAAVRVVFITDGDNNPWPQRLLERCWRISAADRARWGQRRRQEALAALEMLGVARQQAVFLGLPDQGITGLLIGAPAQVIAALRDEIAGWQPSLLVVPSLQDAHPDHNALAVLIDQAMAQLPATQVRPQLFSYLIHGVGIFDVAEYSVSLSPQQLDRKRRAILCHDTQMALGRRRFLRYAQPQEKFLHVPSNAAFQPRHPIQEVSVKSQTLHIRVRTQRWPQLFGQLALSLVADHPQRRIRLRLRLVADSRAAICDAAGKVLGQADVSVGNGMVEVAMPMDILAGAENLYLKLERRWGFFDPAGWRPATARSVEARQVADVVGIIPCYNVEDFCEQVIRHTVHFVDHLIVIDDGSTDHTSGILTKLAALIPERISVIAFPENRGKGVGLVAGFCEALNRFDFQALVTLDGDGQHPPAEIPRLAQAVTSGAEMVIGGRQLDRMPARSRLGNTIVGKVLRWLYPHAPTDTQSGLRAFNREFAAEVVRMVKGSRYETEIQVLLLALSQRRRIVTLPIPTIYIDNNRSSKFRPVTDSIRILYALLGWELSRGYRSKS
ncbi:MAG TPA: PIG-L family deacetylase [Novimethylophilus sp.]|jgi:LmbE family N-acetylglucosaminyl deacetylase|uniref:PIG-L family deacetylase n=1 Tax=Novimethylophilus sp. TaxID=2137426 RepID=UPI002F3E56C0